MICMSYWRKTEYGFCPKWPKSRKTCFLCHFCPGGVQGGQYTPESTAILAFRIEWGCLFVSRIRLEIVCPYRWYSCSFLLSCDSGPLVRQHTLQVKFTNHSKHGVLQAMIYSDFLCEILHSPIIPVLLWRGFVGFPSRSVVASFFKLPGIKIAQNDVDKCHIMAGFLSLITM